MNNTKKKIIGITGGVGAGKSSVLEVLKHTFGARVILSDLVAHDLMEPGSEGLRRVVAALGDSFMEADGTVNRKALAALIFGDDAALATMNGIIHPMVWEAIREEAASCKESLVIVETALIDTAPDGLLDETWYVYTTKENRIARLMESRGYTREKCESIMEAQISDETYRAICGRVIDNNGGTENIETQLKEILGHEIC